MVIAASPWTRRAIAASLVAVLAITVGAFIVVADELASVIAPAGPPPVSSRRNNSPPPTRPDPLAHWINPDVAEFPMIDPYSGWQRRCNAVGVFDVGVASRHTTVYTGGHSGHAVIQDGIAKFGERTEVPCVTMVTPTANALFCFSGSSVDDCDFVAYVHPIRVSGHILGVADHSVDAGVGVTACGFPAGCDVAEPDFSYSCTTWPSCSLQAVTVSGAALDFGPPAVPGGYSLTDEHAQVELDLVAPSFVRDPEAADEWSQAVEPLQEWIRETPVEPRVPPAP